MTSKALVPSSVLYGTEEKAKSDRSKTVHKVPTLKDLVAPQTHELFTINYELIALREKQWRRR
jgi:hypothetical protein